MDRIENPELELIFKGNDEYKKFITTICKDWITKRWVYYDEGIAYYVYNNKEQPDVAVPRQMMDLMYDHEVRQDMCILCEDMLVRVSKDSSTTYYYNAEQLEAIRSEAGRIRAGLGI